MRQIIAALTLVLTLSLGGCQDLFPEGMMDGLVLNADQTEQCLATGGTIQPRCRSELSVCVRTYSDAGQRCRDGDDCQGDCRAVTSDGPIPATGGQCEAVTETCGCFVNLEDGQPTAEMCVG